MWLEYALILYFDEETILSLIWIRFTSLFALLYRVYSFSFNSGLILLEWAAAKVVSLFFRSFLGKDNTQFVPSSSSALRFSFLVRVSIFQSLLVFFLFQRSIDFPSFFPPLILHPVHSKKLYIISLLGNLPKCNYLVICKNIFLRRGVQKISKALPNFHINFQLVFKYLLCVLVSSTTFYVVVKMS